MTIDNLFTALVFFGLIVFAIRNSPAHNGKESDGTPEPHSENLEKLTE